MFHRLVQIKWVFIFLILISNACQASTPVTFKHFSDYVDIQPTKGSQPSQLRAHFTARQKINDRPEDPAYKNNKWKLVMRRGIYLAEVEKTMSELYAYFLGYSTDIDLVEEKGDYYAARRKFKNFEIFEDYKRKNPILITKKENQFFVKDYLLLDDGNLIQGNQTKKLKGLADIAVLTRFFAESDAEMFNYGIQETETELRAIHVDNEHSFSFSDDMSEYPDIENDLAEKFGPEFIQMAWFKQEKQKMLEKIANTDFAIIERIIRKNITVSQLEEGKWTFTKILSDPTVWPEFDRKEAQKKLDELNAMDESQYDVEYLLKEIKARQQKLKEQLKSGTYK